MRFRHQETPERSTIRATGDAQAQTPTEAIVQRIDLPGQEVGHHIYSENYDGTDVETGDATQGFRIQLNGRAEFQDVRVRGDIVTSRMTATPGPNLLSDPSFESGTGDWTAGNVDTTLSQSSTKFRTGTFSLKLSRTTGTMLAALSEQIPTQPGDAFQAEVYLLNEFAFDYLGDLVQLRFYDSTDVLLEAPQLFASWDGGGQDPAAGTWVRYSSQETFFAPENTAYTVLRVRRFDDGTSTADLYVDDAHIGYAPFVTGGFRNFESEPAVDLLHRERVRFDKPDTGVGGIWEVPQIQGNVISPGDLFEQFQLWLKSGSHQADEAFIDLTSGAADGSSGSRIQMDASSIVVPDKDSSAHYELPRLIEKRVVGAATHTLDFTIPSWCSHVNVKWAAVDPAGGDALQSMLLTVNGDNAGNYFYQLEDDGVQAENLGATQVQVGNLDGTTATRKTWGTLEIIDAQSEAVAPSFLVRSGYISAAGNRHKVSVSGDYGLSNAITTITLRVSGAGTTQFAAGSIFWLYGSP